MVILVPYLTARLDALRPRDDQRVAGAPHHAPQEYIDKYKGKFDDGYEANREWVLPRMIAKGLLPKDTQLTPMNPLPDDVAQPADMVRPWNSLNADEKKLFSRLMEVYAGFSEYTDAQVGRIIDYLEQSGQLENTVVLYAADNGASGEGSPDGSVNENKFFNGYPDELSENMKLIDKLGGPDTYVAAFWSLIICSARVSGVLDSDGFVGIESLCRIDNPVLKHQIGFAT